MILCRAGVSVRILVMIVLSALLLGCANDRMGSRLASWQGTHFNDVAAAWGAPEKCFIDESQRICVWQVRPFVSSAMPPSIDQSSCTTTLAFDTENTVTGWRWRGNRCQQTASIVAMNMSEDRPDAYSLGSEDDSSQGVATTEPTEL
jgi:hypothetical protein